MRITTTIYAADDAMIATVAAMTEVRTHGTFSVQAGDVVHLVRNAAKLAECLTYLAEAGCHEVRVNAADGRPQMHSAADIAAGRLARHPVDIHDPDWYCFVSPRRR